MKLLLVVDEPADYEKWKKSQKPLLTENPDLLGKVPDNLKAKAQKYTEPVSAEVTPEVVATNVLGNSSKVLK